MLKRWFPVTGVGALVLFLSSAGVSHAQFFFPIGPIGAMSPWSGAGGWGYYLGVNAFYPSYSTMYANYSYPSTFSMGTYPNYSSYSYGGLTRPYFGTPALYGVPSSIATMPMSYVAYYPPLYAGSNATVVFPGRALSDAQTKATIAYLQKLQTDDGGFRPDTRTSKSSLLATAAALRALKYFGAEPSDESACAAFVKRCFDKKGGGFGVRPGDPSSYQSTAIGIMAVVDLKIPTEPYVPSVVKYLDEHSKSFKEIGEIGLTAASFESLGKYPPQTEAWLKKVTKEQHADGTYGKDDGVARDTGGAVVTIMRLGGKVDHPGNVVKALNAGQRKDGGFGKPGVETSDLETAYRVVRAFHMLKTKPEKTDRLRAFIARCRNEDGGYGVAPRQPSSAGGTYFASIILHWLDEK